jgi:hypothetical protein
MRISKKVTNEDERDGDSLMDADARAVAVTAVVAGPVAVGGIIAGIMAYGTNDICGGPPGVSDGPMTAIMGGYPPVGKAC